jgi:hypothetical protein
MVGARRRMSSQYQNCAFEDVIHSEPSLRLDNHGPRLGSARGFTPPRGPEVPFEEIDSPRSKGRSYWHLSIASSSMRSAPPGAGTLGNLRQGPQRGVDRRRVRKQVGNFGVKDNHV